MRCPCRKKSETTSYEDCCRPYHGGIRLPPTAEALMRSRYSAFVLRQPGYLLATWHPSTRPASLDLAPDQEWVQLRILGTSAMGDRATVEFVARSRIAGRNHTLQELSSFVRESGRWLYVDGIAR